MRRLPVEIIVKGNSGNSIPVNKRLRIGSVPTNVPYFFGGIDSEIVPDSRLVVTELRELASDVGIHALFGFVGEKLEITPKQFFEGCVGAAALWHCDRRSFSNRLPGISYVGYVRLYDELRAVSGHVCRGEWHFDADALDDMCIDWPSGTRIFSPAPQSVQGHVLPQIFRSHTSIRF
jgi:hypothetical protein